MRFLRSLVRLLVLLRGASVSGLPPRGAEVLVSSDPYKLEVAQIEDPSKVRHVITHHKTGTIMARKAISALNDAVTEAELDTKVHGEHMVTLRTDNKEPDEGLVTWANAAPKKWVLHFARNPFEAVASEYAYDMADAEPEWMEFRIDGSKCDPKLAWGQQRFCDAMRDVNAVLTGNLSNVLPSAKAKETYAQYLQRVPEDAGLLVVATAMRQISLESMATTHTRLQQALPERYVMACASDFDVSYPVCLSKWESLLKGALRMPAEHTSKLATAAATSCINGPDNNGAHSAYKDKSDTVRRVERLRELDAAHLGGFFSRLEADVPCAVSERYRP